MNGVVSKFGIIFSQASTWRGIVMVLTALGLKLSEDQGNSIIEAGLAIAGMIGVFWGDHAVHPVPPPVVESTAPPTPPVPNPVLENPQSSIEDIIKETRS